MALWMVQCGVYCPQSFLTTSENYAKTPRKWCGYTSFPHKNISDFTSWRYEEEEGLLEFKLGKFILGV